MGCARDILDRARLLDLAAGVEAKFLGKEFEIARKPIVDKRWNYQAPNDGRCNAAH